VAERGDRDFRGRQYLLIEFVAPSGRQLLGIVETLRDASRIEDHRTRHHWSRERSAARFIDARHRHEAVAHQPLLEAEGRDDFLFEEGKGTGWRTSSHGG
jgi:hypothetical protein